MPTKRNFDQLLLISVLILMGFGLIMVYNTSSVMLVGKYGSNPYHFLKRHLCYMCLAIFVLYVAMKSPYYIWKRWSSVLVFLCLFLLCLVFIPKIGLKAGGASRWIKLAPFLTFQPSELAKIVIVIFIASFLSKKSDQIEESGSISTPLLFILLIFFGIIAAQNDLGTVFLLALVCMSMFFVAGVKLRYLIIPVVCFVSYITFLIISSPYRIDRILSFLDPWSDPRGKGYQIIRSLIAIGCGGTMGLGLGSSIQSGISIPAAFTDFIFAIIAKEIGLIGAGLIVLLFFLVAWRGMQISQHCKESFGQFLAIGITCLICYQAIINMGVVTGLLPTKGITLPFISYGGSSLIFNAFGIGVLLNVSQYT